MDTLFFWISKLVWFVISPFNFLFLCLVPLWFMVLFKKSRYVKITFTIFICSIMLIAIIPFGSLLLHPLETRFNINPQLPDEIEGIIVLSGALNAEKSASWDQIQVNGAVDRELHFMKLARRYPDARLIYSGGSASLINQETKEADTASQLFKEQNIDTSRILFERDARNTWENASNSFKLAQPDVSKTWILITSAFHMPRSVGIFCQLGWPVIPYPVDYQTTQHSGLSLTFSPGGHLLELDLAIHEWLGLLAYRLSGKTNAVLPEACH